MAKVFFFLSKGWKRTKTAALYLPFYVQRQARMWSIWQRMFDCTVIWLMAFFGRLRFRLFQSPHIHTKGENARLHRYYPEELGRILRIWLNNTYIKFSQCTCILRESQVQEEKWFFSILNGMRIVFLFIHFFLSVVMKYLNGTHAFFFRYTKLQPTANKTCAL